MPEILQFFDALGIQKGDELHWRGFPAKNAKGKVRTVITKFPLVSNVLSAWEQQGLGIYLVINAGGARDADITQCRAIFYEHDDLDPAIQITLWRELGLPEPTIQVNTGGKSIHSYWVFDSPIAPDTWRILQGDLLEYSDADRTLKNPSRLMRVPGFKHQGSGNRVTITTHSGKLYSYDELRSAIPERATVQKQVRAIAKGYPSTDLDDALVLEALKAIPPRVPNTGTYLMYRNVLWALKAHFGEDKAVELMENHSPEGWDIRQVARSGGNKFTIGTLFHHAKQHGFECQKANPKTTVIGQRNADNENYRPRFESHQSEGLFWVNFKPIEEDGRVTGHTKERTRIGDHLVAIAYVETPDQDGAALFLEFVDIRNRTRRVTIPRAEIVDGAEGLKTLSSLGYRFRLKEKARLRDYLTQLGGECDQTYVITPKTGWTNGSFVTPDRTYGDESLRFQRVETPSTLKFSQRGTLEDWKTNVAAKGMGNSRLILAMGCAFAGPLLEPLGLESGGIHLAGESSTGKTTAAKLAASVYGPPDRAITQWRATANGLEGVATESNDLCLILDEIGQAFPRDVAAAAYLLANGQAKTRMQKTRQVDPAKTWRLLFFSTGEIAITDYLTQAGLPVKSGQENRLPTVPASPKDGKGVFERVDGNPREWVAELEGAIAQNHGTAFPVYLSALVEARKNPEFMSLLLERHVTLTRTLAAAGEGDEVVGRVAQRFAAVWTALDVAVDFGIVPLTLEDIAWGIQTCFTDWIGARGGVGSIEINQACDRIQHLLISNQMSTRIHVVGQNTFHVQDLLAHRSGDEFWVPTTVFTREFVGDCNKNSLIQELQARGWLEKPTQRDRFTLQRKLDGKTPNFFVFNFSILENWTGTTGTTGTTVLGLGLGGTRTENPNGYHGYHGTGSGFERFLPSRLPVNSDLIEPPKPSQDGAVPVVPVAQNPTGTAQTQSGWGGTRGTRGTREKTQDLKVDPTIPEIEIPDLPKPSQDGVVPVVPVVGLVTGTAKKQSGWGGTRSSRGTREKTQDLKVDPTIPEITIPDLGGRQ